MTEERLPQSVIDEDHALEDSASKAGEKLASLRWHWTLNEGNPDRVSLKAYARAVGRSFSTVHAQANGYAAWYGGDRVTRSLDEAMERAKVGAEKEAVIEAVAEARGVSFQHTRQARSNEVKRVREIARERAEQKGTPVADEAREVAQFLVKAERGEARAEATRAALMGAGYIEVEGHILAMLRSGQRAVVAANKFDFSEEERELLKDTVNHVREVLQLLDARITGVTPIDWDAQLASIMEGIK